MFIVDIELAKRVSIEAHNRAGQIRMGSGLPYWVHPQAVAAIISTIPHTPAMLAAAWLHDVVDDTDVTIEQIFDQFGPDVGRLVWTLSDQEKGMGNRRKRKEAECLRMATALPDEQTLRLGDMLDNLTDTVENNPAFAPVYVPEKARLHAVLTKGNPTLFAKVREALDTARMKIALRAGG